LFGKFFEYVFPGKKKEGGGEEERMWAYFFGCEVGIRFQRDISLLTLLRLILLLLVCWFDDWNCIPTTTTTLVLLRRSYTTDVLHTTVPHPLALLHNLRLLPYSFVGALRDSRGQVQELSVPNTNLFLCNAVAELCSDGGVCEFVLAAGKDYSVLRCGESVCGSRETRGGSRR